MWINLLFSLVFAASPSEFSWENHAESVMKNEIQGIDAGLQDFGLWIKKGDNVAQINGDKKFVPASLSKIPTALTFLNETSLDKNFKTWVYHKG